MLRGPWPAPLLFILLAAQAPRLCAENWPQWRGPRGNSTSEETELPVNWDATTNVAWTAPLAGWGTSTPVVWRDAVFVTSQDNDKLLLRRLDAATGATSWTRLVGQGETPREAPQRSRQTFHRLHNLASPSPVTDGRRVIAHFGNGELAAYDFQGELLWRRNLQRELGTYTVWWGHANSPVLAGDLVISVCVQDSLVDMGRKPAPSYLVAHDAQTGELRWKSMRMTPALAEQGDAYTTPVLADVEGQKQLIVMGANQLDGYDPSTGRQLWYLPELVGGRTVTGPTAADGLVYVTRGMRGPLLAVRVGGSGQLAENRIVWQHEKGTPDTPCPVVVDNLVFTVSDDGIARALDARTGELHWTQRLPGDYKASPLAAAGRVYFLNTTGECTVVAASAAFEKLATNDLGKDTPASPSASAGRLYLRTRTSLVCVFTR